MRVECVSSIDFYFHSACDHRYLHSFPTRRSSDLWAVAICVFLMSVNYVLWFIAGQRPDPQDFGEDPLPGDERSEEHTSELQSHSDLVCRLLLEKKNRVGQTDGFVKHELQPVIH